MLSTRFLGLASSILLAGVVGVACSVSSNREEFNEKDGGGTGSSGNSIGDDTEGGIEDDGLGPKVELSGTTYAPNGTLPLAGVLVYWTTDEPEEIPDGVYCDACVKLPENTSVISGSDGRFKLSVPTGREVYVVTQKGQFRRVRQVTFTEDDDKFDKKTTTLPGRMKKSDGDTIPKIGVMTEPDSTTYDMIQTALKGLGIDQWDDFDNDYGELDNLSSYHIMMFPCGSNAPRNQADKDKVREFTAAGGKVYVSDYAMEWADKVFPEFFEAPMTKDGRETAPKGQFEDDGLAAWLASDGVDEDPSNTKFEGVWSSFHGLQSADVPSPENNGNTITVEPKVWASVTSSGYGSGEASVSYSYGCGREMASIFHVHGRTPDDLLAQEKALLYMLLEVSSCIEPGGDVH